MTNLSFLKGKSAFIKESVYWILTFLIAVTLIFMSVAQAKDTAKDAALNNSGQLLVESFQNPSPLAADNKYFLVYELLLTNFQSSAITLKSLEIEGLVKNAIKFNFTGDDLAELLHVFGPEIPGSNKLILQPGEAKMMFLWLPVSGWWAVPNFLTHKFTFTTLEQDKEKLLSVVLDPLPVNRNPPLLLSPPVRGDYWLAFAASGPLLDASGNLKFSYHRNKRLITNGRLYFSERYAIDFMVIDKNGLTYSGDEHKNESYYCYGKNVFAVGSGTVAAIKNNVPENIPHSRMDLQNFETDPGNVIYIDLGNGKYAVYSHLSPGSINVKVGQPVKQGQLIARLGNSGDSYEPHLHFQVVYGRPSMTEANSIPYAFEGFYLHPAKVTMSPLSGGYFEVKLLQGKLQRFRNQIMLGNTVVKFSDDEK